MLIYPHPPGAGVPLGDALSRLSIDVPDYVVCILADLVDDDRAFGAGVGNDLAKGLFAELAKERPPI